MSEFNFDRGLSILSLIITLVGFALTIYQLVKTKNVAEASRDEAIKTKESIDKINSVVTIHEITNLFSLLKSALKNSNISVSIVYIEYIREKISSIKGKYQENNKKSKKLDEYLKKIVEIHNSLERSKIYTEDPKILTEFIMSISEIRDSLSEMLAKNISNLLDDEDSKNENS